MYFIITGFYGKKYIIEAMKYVEFASEVPSLKKK